MTMSPLDGHPRLAVTVWAVGTLAVSAIAIGASHALADSEREVIRFDRASGTHATAVDRIVIRGEGCLAAEDMTELRLVDYAPSRDVVIYRCVTP